MPGPLFAFPLKNNTYRVIDGDTVEVVLDRGFFDQMTTSLRLGGLNAPESRTRRALEKKAGLLVKQVVIAWLEGRKDSHLYATSDQKPKYARRTIGRIWANNNSNCLNDYLLKLEIVKVYNGGTREKFTDEELGSIIERCEQELM
jgi:micrococcal nuclease